MKINHNDVNAFSDLARFAKRSSLEDQVTQRAVQNLGYMAVGGLGVGAGVRGARGLYNLLSRHVAPPRPNYPQAVVTRIPVPIQDESDDDDAMPTAKVAEVTTPSGKWWYWPAAALATGGGAMLGWKGVDSALESQRRAAKEREVDEAKGEFEQSLLGSYTKPVHMDAGMLPKTAGAELGELLDGVFDGMAKSALNWDNVTGQLAGGYGLYALATGIPAAMWAYNQGEAGSQRSVLNKAMKQRVLHDYHQQPSSIYAVPDPVSVGRRDAPAAAAAVEPESDDASQLAETASGPTPTSLTAPFAGGAPRRRRVLSLES